MLRRSLGRSEWKVTCPSRRSPSRRAWFDAVSPRKEFVVRVLQHGRLITEAGSAGTAVLFHGGLVDGSGRRGVYDQLKNDGDTVAIAQNRTLSLKGDVAAANRVIDAQSQPVILVGHSYGGARTVGR